MDLIKTKSELLEYLKSIKHDKEIKNIAVEALIFDKNDRLVLVLRGPNSRDEIFKLEGIGGRYKDDDGTFQDSLIREIQEEIGNPNNPEEILKINIDRLLEVRPIAFKDNKSNEMVNWIVISHLCRLEEGIPFNAEPHKHISIEYLTLNELFQWPEDPVYSDFAAVKDHEFSFNIRPGLSKSLVEGRRKYNEEYGNNLYDMKRNGI